MTRPRWLLLIALAWFAGLLSALWWNAADRAERKSAERQLEWCNLVRREEQEMTRRCQGELQKHRSLTIGEVFDGRE